MLREIKKKMIILNNRMPFSPEIKNYFSYVQKVDWIYMNMQLEGSSVTRDQIEDYINGNGCIGLTIGDNLLVQNLGELLNKLFELYDLRQKLNLDFLDSVYYVLCKGGSNRSEGYEYGQYRRRSLVIYEWDYTPPSPGEIAERMRNLALIFDDAMAADASREECFEYAEKIHNGILSICPFPDKNALVARAAVAYYLLIKGYPVVVPSIKEQHYNEIVSKALKTGNSGNLQGLNEVLKKEILDRMKLMIQLTTAAT
ncbi:MAG: Fic family protein [Firmicutes bacterium]|nr:Fic family protein [Bacillota bacterium]